MAPVSLYIAGAALLLVAVTINSNRAFWRRLAWLALVCIGFAVSVCLVESERPGMTMASAVPFTAFGVGAAWSLRGIGWKERA